MILRIRVQFFESVNMDSQQCRNWYANEDVPRFLPPLGAHFFGYTSGGCLDWVGDCNILVFFFVFVFLVINSASKSAKLIRVILGLNSLNNILGLSFVNEKIWLKEKNLLNMTSQILL